MDAYKKHHDSDFRRKWPADEARRTKIRREKDTTESNNNGSSGTNSNSNSTSSFLYKHPQLNEEGGRSRGRSPRMGFDPWTDDKLYKTSIRSPNLPPCRPVNEKKVVNWRLACFMANEYLTRGTLLGTPWLPQDPNPKCRHETNDKSEGRYGSLDQDRDESRREKEMIYDTVANFLRAGDVHLPGIVNPSQLAAWLGLNQKSNK